MTGNRAEMREKAAAVLALMREDEAKLIRQAKQLVKKHKSTAARLFTTEVDGWTPLHACVLRGSKHLLKTMLSAGVEVNFRMGQPEGLPW